ncbi:MAG: type II secretion system protein, partial [Planctomycetota bacterium]
PLAGPRCRCQSQYWWGISEMRATARPGRRGFTLLELVLAMLVMGVIGATVTPVIVAETDAYATARALRSETQATRFAIDRITRCLREAPAGSVTRLSVASGSESSLMFSDGNGIQLTDTTLEIVTPDATAPIARNISGLTIDYIDDDGVSPVADPANTHRFHIEFMTDNQTIRFRVFPRVNIGSTL